VEILFCIVFTKFMVYFDTEISDFRFLFIYFIIIIIIIIISNLSNDRSKASSKTIPPHSAI